MSSATMHTNGLADQLLKKARENIADNKASDADRQMIVMEALSARTIAAVSNRKELTIKIFGREWTAAEIVFGFGFLIAAEGGIGFAALKAFD